MFAPMAWTFQSLIDGGMEVTANCLNCRHTQKLDLAALIDKLGPDTPAMAEDLAPRMKCSTCKGRAVSFSYTPDASRHVGMGHSNAYAKARDGR